jgi:hypothetical protein
LCLLGLSVLGLSLLSPCLLGLSLLLALALGSLRGRLLGLGPAVGPSLRQLGKVLHDDVGPVSGQGGRLADPIDSDHEAELSGATGLDAGQ